MMKRHKKLIAFIVFLIVSLSIFFALFVSKAKQGEAILNQLTFDDIVLSSIKDGTYKGHFDAGLVYVEVSIDVKDGEFITIELLEHRNGLGSEAEAMIETMIEKQTTHVDFVSGSTISSKAIRKAVENALLNH